MKKILFTLIIGASLIISSCDPSEFDDTNISPTQLKEAPTKALLTFALQQIPFTTYNSPARQLGGYQTEVMALYSQYLSEGPYPGGSLYSGRTFAWTSYYTGPLYNLQTIIDYNNSASPLASPGPNGSTDNQVAVARILKAYFFWWLTDRYGDIPYTDALKGNQNLQPKYDTQQAIYESLFTELKEAQAQIKSGEAGVTGDILCGGDMLLWKKFANTTRMYMALRLIKNDFARAQTEFSSAITDGVIEDGDDIVYNFIGTDPNNWNPWYENYSNDNRNDYAISTTLADYMIANDDARLRLYGEVLASGSVGGLSYGTNAARNIPGAYSRLGEGFQSAGAQAPIFTYAQSLFVKAEGAKQGLIPGGDATAQQFYEDAIQASLQFYGVGDTYPEFIAKSDIAYDPANGLEQIITQKWVHQYLNGFEAWTDWRRTGFPVLEPAEDSVDDRGIPLRQGYPSNARALNQAGYDAAIAQQGADDNYTAVWWDK